MVSYSPPHISSVSGCTATSNAKETKDCARLGGTTITIQGDSFGAAGATVLIGSSQVRAGGTLLDCPPWLAWLTSRLVCVQCNKTTHDLVTPHTKLTCVVPGDNGLDRTVIGQCLVPAVIAFGSPLPGSCSL